MNQDELIEKITNEVMERLKAEMARGTAAQVSASDPSPASLAKYIDHTMLKPEALDAAFDTLCDEAVQWGFKSVCVNSTWVSKPAAESATTRKLYRF